MPSSKQPAATAARWRCGCLRCAHDFGDGRVGRGDPADGVGAVDHGVGADHGGVAAVERGGVAAALWLYRRIPQYELINEGFGLEGFKQIFWLEWTHRLWGRLMGVVFVVPFAVLMWRRAIVVFGAAAFGVVRAGRAAGGGGLVHGGVGVFSGKHRGFAVSAGGASGAGAGVVCGDFVDRAGVVGAAEGWRRRCGAGAGPGDGGAGGGDDFGRGVCRRAAGGAHLQ